MRVGADRSVLRIGVSNASAFEVIRACRDIGSWTTEGSFMSGKIYLCVWSLTFGIVTGFAMAAAKVVLDGTHTSLELLCWDLASGESMADTFLPTADTYSRCEQTNKSKELAQDASRNKSSSVRPFNWGTN
jgi:hypothetical protein